jgi:hypothetical protein
MGAGYYSKRLMARDRDRDEHFYRRAVWVKRFAWWPKRCDCSGRWLWLQRVMMGVAMYHGSGDPVFEFRWHSAKEHVVFLLKGNPNGNV